MTDKTSEQKPNSNTIEGARAAREAAIATRNDMAAQLEMLNDRVVEAEDRAVQIANEAQRAAELGLDVGTLIAKKREAFDLVETLQAARANAEARFVKAETAAANAGRDFVRALVRASMPVYVDGVEKALAKAEDAARAIAHVHRLCHSLRVLEGRVTGDLVSEPIPYLDLPYASFDAILSILKNAAPDLHAEWIKRHGSRDGGVTGALRRGGLAPSTTVSLRPDVATLGVLSEDELVALAKQYAAGDKQPLDAA